MVEAVAMHTTGLGGDSEVSQDPDSPELRLRLGPRRVIPVSLLGSRFPGEVHAALDRQAAMPFPAEHAGRFAAASGRGGSGRSSDGLETELLEALAEVPAPLDALLTSRRHEAALRRLVGRGAALLSGFTPSDAAHVLGFHGAWDREAARKAAALFARKRTRLGEGLAADAEAMSHVAIEAVLTASAEFILDAGFAEDGYPERNLSAHALVQAGLQRRPALVRLQIGLSAPLIALGAAAPAYYGGVAERLNTEAVIPDHADVANAIGAAVGHVRVTGSVTISRPSDERFRVHLENGPQDFDELVDAAACAEQALRQQVVRKAAANGAPDVEVTIREDRQTVLVGHAEMLLEMTVSAIAVGRPSFLHPTPPKAP